MLRHLIQLGLRVNWEKRKLSLTQKITFLSMELDSVEQTARLTEERAQSLLNCLNSFKGTDALAHSWLWDLHKYAFPPVRLLAQTLLKPFSTSLYTFLGPESRDQSTSAGPIWALAVNWAKVFFQWKLCACLHWPPSRGLGTCTCFRLRNQSVTLRSQPGHIPKILTTPFRDKVVNLQALPPDEADPALALFWPVCALRLYADLTQNFRTSEQLFVCYGGRQKRNAISKQRMAHWKVVANRLGLSSTWRALPAQVASSLHEEYCIPLALTHGASLMKICRVVGWATPNTFARFYSLRVERYPPVF